MIRFILKQDFHFIPLVLSTFLVLNNLSDVSNKLLNAITTYLTHQLFIKNILLLSSNVEPPNTFSLIFFTIKH
jgi:hypothetical protein